ncbi:MAG: hypothetical protein Q4F10_13800 [Corynebacterium glutamicum]|nr:hypothetical protein [Corynebacterium glutamicum]
MTTANSINEASDGMNSFCLDIGDSFLLVVDLVGADTPAGKLETQSRLWGVS